MALVKCVIRLTAADERRLQRDSHYYCTWKIGGEFYHNYRETRLAAVKRTIVPLVVTVRSVQRRIKDSNSKLYVSIIQSLAQLYQAVL